MAAFTPPGAIGLSIVACNAKHFAAVQRYIQVFELDNRQLKPEDFLIALMDDALVGFGRVREYADCSELCSLGVTEPHRCKGIGSALVQALAQKAQQPLYLVCIIPPFFEPLGFATCTHYPTAMQQKLDYCSSALPVAEAYVVMAKK